jgi:hypothetical protein
VSVRYGGRGKRLFVLEKTTADNLRAGTGRVGVLGRGALALTHARVNVSPNMVIGAPSGVLRSPAQDISETALSAQLGPGRTQHSQWLTTVPRRARTTVPYQYKIWLLGDGNEKAPFDVWTLDAPADRWTERRGDRWA